MIKHLCPHLVVVFAAASLFGQQPTPTPTADTDVVKISTNLIQVDVTVTDKSGKIVRDSQARGFRDL